jgi:purine-nucleoside phosphorylase
MPHVHSVAQPSEQIARAREVVARQSSLVPRIGVVLGSGLSTLADAVEAAVVIPYRDLPGIPVPTIAGHRGNLVLGTLAGQAVALLCGRSHFYEGYTMQQITLGVRLLRALGCDTLIVTGAAGGLVAAWQAGDIMQITDQVFLPGMAGHHPLRGPNDDRLGPRFPAMVGAFDSGLAAVAHQAAAACHLTLRAGVYAMLSGPSFESSAELRMLRVWGVDAVGMSTAPEVIVARHSGMRVLGLSLITNLALPDGKPASHAEVLDASAAAVPGFGALLHTTLAMLPPAGAEHPTDSSSQG